MKSEAKGMASAPSAYTLPAWVQSGTLSTPALVSAAGMRMPATAAIA